MFKFNYSKKDLFFARLIPLLFFFFIFSSVSAQSKKNKVFKFLNIELGLGTIYNDNILEYSDYYLSKFLNKQDSGRFYINTSDGLVLDHSVKVASTFQFFGKNKTVLVGSFRRKSYVNNKIKSWNQIDFGIKQYFNWKITLNLSYSYIPKFYIRHFRDDDLVNIYGYTPETFQPFEFAENDYGLWIEKAFFKHNFTRLRFSFNYEQNFYNKYFTEYDCNNKIFAVRFYQSIRDKLKFKIGYQYIISNAKGYDGFQETKENSDDSDPSYKADEFSGTIEYPLPRIFNKQHTISVDFEYKRSCFSSKHYLEIDRIHAGRIDNFYKIEINYEMKLLRSLSISGFYKWCKRDSDTRAEANKVYLSQEKDYTQQQFGLALTYNFKDITFTRSRSKQDN
jgi:hypothetical protein